MKFIKSNAVKVLFFKMATKISKRQIDGEDLLNFCGLLRKHEL